MLPKASVIIPAYNAAAFLHECLDSVAAQSFADFEVLVIDDGSSDSTAAIAAEWTRKDPRFSLIKVPNGGVSRARNIGIERARGELVTFVDADDVLHPEALKAMVTAIEECGADVCITGFRPFVSIADKSVRKLMKRSDPQSEVVSYEEAMRLALYQKRLLNSPWGAMMRRSLLGKERRFREGIRYEDLDAFYRFYEGAERIVLLPFPFYLYRTNPDSFMNRWSSKRLDVLDVTDRLVEFFSSNYPSLGKAALDRRFSAHYNMFILMRRNRHKDSEALERCRKIIREGRLRALTDPSVRIKNKVGALLSYLFV